MSSDASSEFDPARIESHRFPERTYTYSERDVALYALGIGACAQNAVDVDELKYVYHDNGQKFIQVLPTFAALFSFGSPPGGVSLPGLQYDPRILLHGQQYIELYKRLPSSAVDDCLSARCWWILKIISQPYSYATYPKDQVASVKIPSFVLGPKKIATCSHGQYRMACAHLDFQSAIVKCICREDPNLVKCVSGRFLLHVYPSETLLPQMWLQGLRVIYQTKVKERSRAVLSGYLETTKG